MLSLKTVRNGAMVAALATFPVAKPAYADGCFSWGDCTTCYISSFNGKSNCTYWAEVCGTEQVDSGGGCYPLIPG